MSSGPPSSGHPAASRKPPSPVRKPHMLTSVFRPPVLLLAAAYFVASLAHFSHNAEYIAFYPGMPGWLTRETVYLAWLGITSLGVLALVFAQLAAPTFALLFLAAYGAAGLDGLGHYMLALCSEHTLMSNLTIWTEAVSGLALLLVAAILLARRGAARRGASRQSAPSVLADICCGPLSASAEVGRQAGGGFAGPLLRQTRVLRSMRSTRPHWPQAGWTTGLPACGPVTIPTTTAGSSSGPTATTSKPSATSLGNSLGVRCARASLRAWRRMHFGFSSTDQR